MIYSSFKKLLSEFITDFSGAHFRFSKHYGIGRDEAHIYLKELGLCPGTQSDSKVLVDGMWWNPNHIFRYTLLRAAIGLSEYRETVIIGEKSPNRSKASFKEIGINEFIQFKTGDTNKYKEEIAKYLNKIKSWDDLFENEFYENFPAEIIYDAITKEESDIALEFDKARFSRYISRLRAYQKRAREILSDKKIKLLVLSHSVNLNFCSLALEACRQKIPVIVIYGEYGTLRFWKIEKPTDVYMGSNFLSRDGISRLTESQLTDLEQKGSTYLNSRIGAKTVDIGAKRAFARDKGKINRDKIIDHFNWDSSKPIIALYGMSWIDYPHLYGPIPYRNPLEWIFETIEIAKKTKNYNLIIRPHPCENLRGTRGLCSYLPINLPEHIRICETGWSGADIMHSVDGLLTLYGTAGVEYPAHKKPVLSLGKGWYGDVGFTLNAKNRLEYVECLEREWWKGVDFIRNQKIAKIFAGWHFCKPDWKEGYCTGDDFTQLDLYRKIIINKECNGSKINKEIECIREWWKSSIKGYHNYTMENATKYATN